MFGTKEGVLRYDTDDGWVLDGERPEDGIRIRDLFREFDGKRVRVTVEALPGEPGTGQKRTKTMTGAYAFKKFQPCEGQDHWDTPPGHWCAWSGNMYRGGGVRVPQLFVLIRCPECSTCGMLPHQIDAQGGIHPSVVCTGPDRTPGTCQFHTQPTTLLEWDRGERTATKNNT